MHPEALRMVLGALDKCCSSSPSLRGSPGESRGPEQSARYGSTGTLLKSYFLSHLLLFVWDCFVIYLMGYVYHLSVPRFNMIIFIIM